MPDHVPTPTPADYAVPLAEHLADLDALGPFATRHTAASHEAALRLALHWRADNDRLRAILDAPREALFADGREPSRNECHLLNLLSWRQKEAEEAKAERDALLRLDAGQVDELLERWDQTDPAIQRGIVAKFAGMVNELREERDRLRGVLRGILGMAEHDIRTCRDGSLEQIAADARAALEGKGAEGG